MIGDYCHLLGLLVRSHQCNEQYRLAIEVEIQLVLWERHAHFKNNTILPYYNKYCLAEVVFLMVKWWKYCIYFILFGQNLSSILNHSQCWTPSSSLEQFYRNFLLTLNVKVLCLWPCLNGKIFRTFLRCQKIWLRLDQHLYINTLIL